VLNEYGLDHESPVGGGALVILGVALVVGMGIKLFDLGRSLRRRGRTASGPHDRAGAQVIGEVPLTVVAHASASAREPVVIEIGGPVATGPVATIEAREWVLRQARFEAARLGRDVRVADRLEARTTTNRVA
jgi:hypothetical protein